MKTFNIMYNVGKAKYLVNYHNGMQMHKDRSPFFGIKIFRNKKDLNAFKIQLLKNGYKETSFIN